MKKYAFELGWQLHHGLGYFCWSYQSTHRQCWIFERFHFKISKIWSCYDNSPCATVCCTQNPSFIEESATTEYACKCCGVGSGETHLPSHLSSGRVLTSNNSCKVAPSLIQRSAQGQVPVEGITAADASRRRTRTWFWFSRRGAKWFYSFAVPASAIGYRYQPMSALNYFAAA